jgi:hypothetical protein
MKIYNENRKIIIDGANTLMLSKISRFCSARA